jgi:hypothetical protein
MRSFWPYVAFCSIGQVFDRCRNARTDPALGLRVLDEAAEGVNELHLLDGLAAGFQQTRRADQHGEALGAGDGHVQAIAREEK